MDRRRFWTLLPFVVVAPKILAEIKPDSGPKHFTGGIVKFIQESNSDNMLEWTAGITEEEFDKWTNQVFKHSDITAEWCRQSGFHVEKDDLGYYVQNHFGRLYLLR